MKRLILHAASFSLYPEQLMGVYALLEPLVPHMLRSWNSYQRHSLTKNNVITLVTWPCIFCRPENIFAEISKSSKMTFSVKFYTLRDLPVIISSWYQLLILRHGMVLICHNKSWSVNLTTLKNRPFVYAQRSQEEVF